MQKYVKRLIAIAAVLPVAVFAAHRPAWPISMVDIMRASLEIPADGIWAIEGSDAPKSLGLLKIDARNDVTLPADVLAKFGPGTTLAISLEPLGGSPNPTPTGPVVAAGKATPI